MNKKIDQNYNGFDFIFKSNYTDISKPAAPLIGMRNSAGFSFYPPSFNLPSKYTKRSHFA